MSISSPAPTRWRSQSGWMCSRAMVTLPLPGPYAPPLVPGFPPGAGSAGRLCVRTSAQHGGTGELRGHHRLRARTVCRNHISCCLIHRPAQRLDSVGAARRGMATRTSSWPSRLGWLSLVGFCISQMMAGWIGQGVQRSVGCRRLPDLPEPSSPHGPRLENHAFVDWSSTAVIPSPRGIGLAAAGLLPAT